MSESLDVLFLQKALELARIHRGFCAPNPAVGAVIVKDNAIIATGYHKGPGSLHAEINALDNLTSIVADGATLYVTLEPCCHYGKTPPCTDAVIKAGIKRVVYGFCDPNPIVAGNGHRALDLAGVHTQHISTQEIDAFYKSYQRWHQTQKPFMTAKIALSIDGKIAAKSGAPIKITGTELQQFTHASRRASDAILTTAKTIIADDPQLNVRLHAEIISKALYVLDSDLTLPLTASILRSAQSVTVFHADSVSLQRRDQLTQKGVRCIPVAKTPTGLDLRQVIALLGQDGRHDVWIEAGGKCFSAFMTEKLLQRAFIYVAPLWVGQGIAAFADDFSLDREAGSVHWRQYGSDVLCEINW